MKAVAIAADTADSGVWSDGLDFPRPSITDEQRNEIARQAAATICAAARVLVRHIDDAEPHKRALLLGHIEAAEGRLRDAMA
jgi:hypothetical protein